MAVDRRANNEQIEPAVSALNRLVCRVYDFTVGESLESEIAARRKQ